MQREEGSACDADSTEGLTVGTTDSSPLGQGRPPGGARGPLHLQHDTFRELLSSSLTPCGECVWPSGADNEVDQRGQGEPRVLPIKTRHDATAQVGRGARSLWWCCTLARKKPGLSQSKPDTRLDPPGRTSPHLSQSLREHAPFLTPTPRADSGLNWGGGLAGPQAEEGGA